MADVWQLPLSGAVTQSINPVTWWVRGAQQVGFINVYATNTPDAALERRIVEDVASYGRQLGRIMDALDVLLARAERERTGAWDASERAAVAAFRELVRDVAAVKEQRAAGAVGAEIDVDALAARLEDLRRRDPALHGETLRRLRAVLG